MTRDLAERVSADNIVRGGADVLAGAHEPRRNYAMPQCSRETGPDCFLSPEERQVAVNNLQDTISDALVTYKSAIQTVEMSVLLEKPESPHWLLSVALDLIGSSLVGQVAKFGLKAQGKLLHGIGDFFSGLGASKMEKVAEKAIGLGKAGGMSVAQSGLERGDAAKKMDSTSFLTDLADRATKSFRAMRENLPAMSTDRQLETLYDAFTRISDDKQSVVNELQAKLRRYRASGVSDIGRQEAEREDERLGLGGLAGVAAGKPLSRSVIRDTRVAWHVYKSGFPTQLVFEHQDGEREISFKGAREYVSGNPTFGPGRAVTDSPEYGNVVPAEFIQIAIARHEQAWGQSVPYLVVDDTKWLDPMRMAAAAKLNGRK